MTGEDKIGSMMHSLGMEDMNIPELKLIQATGGDYAKTQAGAKAGQFYVSTTNELSDRLNVQVLMVTKQRTFWGRNDITEEPPLCSSTDGETGSEGQLCRQCPHFRERAAIDKEERRKECQTGYVVLALDEQGTPLVIRLGGISADAGRDLNAMLYFNKGLRSDRGGFFFQITSFEKKSAAGTAYAFKFTLVKDKFPDEQQKLEYNRVVQDMGMLAAPRQTPPTTGAIGPRPEPLAIPEDTKNRETQTIASSEVGKVEDVLPNLDF